MGLDQGDPVVLASCSACELTLVGPSPIMGDSSTNYQVSCDGAARRGESMPESSPELRYRDACWLMKDTERKLRRRPLRSLYVANCEAFNAVGRDPCVAVVDERRNPLDEDFRCEGAPFHAWWHSSGRFRCCACRCGGSADRGGRPARGAGRSWDLTAAGDSAAWQVLEASARDSIEPGPIVARQPVRCTGPPSICE
jgi:hypothetical protein